MLIEEQLIAFVGLCFGGLAMVTQNRVDVASRHVFQKGLMRVRMMFRGSNMTCSDHARREQHDGSSRLRTMVLGLAASCGILAFSNAASAIPITVTDTVSGSSGDWTYTFTVRNEISVADGLYFFGVELPDAELTGSPQGWSDNGNWTINRSGLQSYDVTWHTSSNGPYLIAAGASLSGFVAHSTAVNIETDIPFFAYGYGVDDDADDGHFNPGTGTFNPGFQGLVNRSVSSVPLPASAPLFGAALLALGSVGYGMSRRQSPA